MHTPAKMNDVEAFLTLLAYFSNNHTFSLKEIASATTIPERTIQRYIQKFRHAGIAIKSDSGHGGGYSIPASATLPRLISADELVALLFAFEALSELTQLPFEMLHFATTRQRLLASLPSFDQKHFATLQSVIQFSLSQRQLPTSQLDSLRDCAITKQMIRIHYTSANHTRIREITPSGLYLFDGVWYCPAFCHHNRDERLFRADRIQIITHLEPDPHPHSTLQQWRDTYNNGPTDDVLTFQLTTRGQILAQAIPWMDGHLTPVGTHYTIPIHRYKQSNLIEDILSFGPHITVLEPDSFVTAIKTNLQQALDNY